VIPVPRVVLEALAAKYHIPDQQLVKFGGGEESSDGIVFRYPFNQNQRLLKVMAFPLAEQRISRMCFEERLKFIRYLGENGANIVYPLLSPEKKLYETFDDENHLWVAYSMALVPGRSMSEKTWDQKFFRNWGQTIGLCHRLARRYPTWLGIMDDQTGAALLTWRREWDAFYRMCPDEEIKTRWEQIRESLEQLPVEREVFGFIHNDPHMWNLLVDGDRITLLDFDVANHHWYINDIAIACQSILIFHSGGLNGPLRRLDKLEEFLGAFMQGYQRENDLSLDWLRHLDLFISYRRILLYLVMTGWIHSQPKLHKTWRQLILSPPVILGS
jgi:Ser/Thr protein kinase RdoA (MazF antagonist)